MRILETMPCHCLTTARDDKPRAQCPTCHGVGTKPIREGIGYLWADLKWRNEKPPSEVPIPVPPSAPTEHQLNNVNNERLADYIGPEWQPTQRTMLRERALDYAIRAAPLTGSRLTGRDILNEAEHIERWIVTAGVDG